MFVLVFREPNTGTTAVSGYASKYLRLVIIAQNRWTEGWTDRLFCPLVVVISIILDMHSPN